MISYKQIPDYGDPRGAGPDRLLMFLVFGFIMLVLLRSFWLSADDSRPGLFADSNKSVVMRGVESARRKHAS
jgi:hypothetical protein